MRSFQPQHFESILFITLDSCRFDTFEEAQVPHMKSIGALHRAWAPGNFTYASHAAMFVGFTPGIAGKEEPFINPKFAKIFKMTGGGFGGVGRPFMTLTGTNIIDGLNNLGYETIGTAALGWFNPQTATGRHLSQDFRKFFFHPGRPFALSRQLDWLSENLAGREDSRVFCFLNVGETHVPYYHEGASWSPEDNPCIPFSDANDREECHRRQKACLEYVDSCLVPLLDAFRHGSIILCSDHGDCWGEEGLWEHGIHHEKVLEVPLIFRLNDKVKNA